MDRMSSEIITGRWSEGERIPSVRESAVALQVNPNTVMRAYESMQNDDIIFNRRGIGYFVSEGARKKITARGREEFEKEILPAIFRHMEMLEISFDTLAEIYKKNTKNR